MDREKTRKKLSARGWVLLGGGSAVGLLLLILLAGTTSVDSLRFLGLDSLKRSTLARLEAGATPALREELRRGFDCVIGGAATGRLSDEEVGRFARACRRATADGRVTREEVEVLRDLARQLCKGR
jgi:hypothetical protein